MADTPPLSREEVERILRAFAPLSSDRRIILVGGQAVAFWMHLLAPLEDGVLGHAWLSSKDIDFEGSAQAVRRAGKLIGGQVKIPTLDEPHTPNTGIVVFVDSEGHSREIDFIEAPLGLRARDVRDTAVPYELPGRRGQESLRFWIMHPERCMESRVVNAVELGKTDQLALRQLHASVTCARLWSRFLLDSDALPEEQRVRAVLNLNERVFAKCSRDRRFRRIFHDRGIDPFDAVLTGHPLLPGRFQEQRLPQMLERLKERRHRDRRNWSRAARTARQDGVAG